MELLNRSKQDDVYASIIIIFTRDIYYYVSRLLNRQHINKIDKINKYVFYSINKSSIMILENNEICESNNIYKFTIHNTLLVYFLKSI